MIAMKVIESLQKESEILQNLEDWNRGDTSQKNWNRERLSGPDLTEAIREEISIKPKVRFQEDEEMKESIQVETNESVQPKDMEQESLTQESLTR